MIDSSSVPTLRAVVTGASSGIGAATVRLLRAHGWEVTAVARRADRLAALAAETGCAIVVADLTVASEVHALAERVRAAGPLHALVANAGGAIGTDPVATVSSDVLAASFALNVLTAHAAIAALLPALRLGAVERGSGDIVAITSTAGQVAYEGGGAYNAAKFALRGLLGALRLELAGEPLRVVQIAPGMVRTEEFAAKRFGGDHGKVEALYAGVDHPLLAEDVADAIVHAIELPSHVNLDEVTIRPVAQAAQHKLVREPLRVREG